MNAIEINDLDFSYKSKELILTQVNMCVPKGGIYGFLGPNGAGKTTTLKLILSLLNSKEKGSIKLLGNDILQNYPAYLKQLGSLIEDPSIYGHLSAKDNLKIWRNYHNTDTNRVEEVLEIIGLSHAKNKKVQHFSTGMKQRLGIGVSIMHDPEILILDEPTNGLDPLGINDLRTLLHNLSADGKTILLSSHILSEVEKLVENIGIIKEGRMIYEGTLHQLNETAMQDSIVTVSVDNIILANEHLSKYFPTQIVDDKLSVSISSKSEINQIASIIIENNMHLYELTQPKKSLENIFMKLAK